MLRVPLLVSLIASVFVLSCADTVVQTASVSVKVAENVDFTQFETFSVVTKGMADPPPDLDPDHEAFNDLVNELIIEAMQAEPVCLEFIPPEEASQNTPDLFGANALGQTEEGGWVYECCGGWWWGYWGWYWDPCAYWCPAYVEYDADNLLIPVAVPGATPEEAEAVFAGLATAVSGIGPDVETKVRTAVDAIFAQWPDQRTCPAE